MIELSVKQILEATGGTLVNGSKESVVSGISIDSRTTKPGDLFIALNGENFEGADFIEEALKKGACGYVVQRSEVRGQRSDLIVIEVPDSLKALQGIASYLLKQVNPKVIAVTGSTGKTSVKDMLKSVLESKYRVLASIGNYNNEVGLPLTLLNLKPDTEVIVVEMGMRGLGQIKELCDICPPDYAVITNIGHSHIELLKTKENILKAKTEIIEGLKPGGVAVLNSALSSQVKTIYFGGDKKADVSYNNLILDNLARASFDLIMPPTPNPQPPTTIRLPISGAHQALNALAVAAIANELGFSTDEIKESLQNIQITSGRMEIIQNNGWLIINDSYNASPDSMKAAVKTLSNIDAKRKVAILGSMLELGDVSEPSHKEVGKIVAVAGINQLITVGSLGRFIAKGALTGGMEARNIISFDDNLALMKEIDSYLRPDDVILIKASRAIELDKIADYLQKKR